MTDGQMIPYKAKVESVRGLLEKAKTQIAMALPKHITADKMARLAMTAIQKNPVLLDADKRSLIGAIIQSAQLGLEIDVAGQAYLVPFRNKKKEILEVQLIPGYRGLINLARRSGEIVGFEAAVVHKRDTFSFQRGTDPKIVHLPFWSDDPQADPGKPIAAYAVATFSDGSKQFDVMSLRELEGIRNRSKAKDSGPWTTDTEEMYKKTVVRRLSKLLPVSVELDKAVELDNQAEMGLPQDLGDVVDIEVVESKSEPAEPQKSALDAATEQLQKESPKKDDKSEKKLEPWQLEVLENEKAEARKK